MGFEAAHANMESGLETGGLTPESSNQDLSSGTGDSAPESASGASDSPTLQELVDLDKIEKFKLHGEEMTREDLSKSMLRQADYTRKTQEFSKERKFYDNLAYDLANVLKNPALEAKFKQMYPEKFHQYLEPYRSYLQTQPNKAGGEKSVADPQLMARLNQVEGKFHAQEVKAAEVMLDGIFKDYSAKYPYADEASVISKSLALMEQKMKNGEPDNLTKGDWDRVFKTENDRVQKLAEAQYKQTVTNQLKANRKAKDIGTGGDAVGQAPKRMTMKEATEAAIRDAMNGTLR